MIEIYFAEENGRKSFEKLKTKKEFLWLYRVIQKAMDDILNDPDCGSSLKKHLIPKEYIRKYDINNLYKYNLPNGWRLLYSLGKKGIEIVAIILEWCSHKEYEKLFKFKAR